jgi:hypothetical protein
MKGALSKPGTEDLQRYIKQFEEALDEMDFTQNLCCDLWKCFSHFVEDPDEKPYIPDSYIDWVRDCLLPLLPPGLENIFTIFRLYDAIVAALGGEYVERKEVFGRYIRDNPEVYQLCRRIEQCHFQPRDLMMIAKHFKLRNSVGHFFRGEEYVGEVAFCIAFYLGATYEGPITLPAIIQTLQRVCLEEGGEGIDETEPLVPHD